MKREILFVKEIAVQADNLYPDGERFGAWAAQAFAVDGRRQIKELENIVNSSLKVSDVLDYLKKQTAKSKAGEKWRHGPEQDQLGPALIGFISGDLKNKRNTVSNKIGADTSQAVSEAEKQQVYLALIREFVRQMAAQYELKGGRNE